jgi:hypothetical protein
MEEEEEEEEEEETSQTQGTWNFRCRLQEIRQH